MWHYSPRTKPSPSEQARQAQGVLDKRNPYVSTPRRIYARLVQQSGNTRVHAAHSRLESGSWKLEITLPTAFVSGLRGNRAMRQSGDCCAWHAWGAAVG